MTIFQKIKRILLKEPMEDPDADIDEIIERINTQTVDERQRIDRVELKSDGDVDVVIEKLTMKQIVLVDMSPLLRNRETLKKLIKRLSASCERMKWQICRVSNEMVLVTPNNIRINTGA